MKSTRTQRPPAIPVAPKKKGSKFGSLVAITIAAGAIYAGFTHKDEIVEDFSPPPKQPEVIVVEDKPILPNDVPEVVVKVEPKPTPVKPKPTPVVVAEPEPKFDPELALASYQDVLLALEKLEKREAIFNELNDFYSEDHPKWIDAKQNLSDYENIFLREFDFARKGADANYWKQIKFDTRNLEQARRLVLARATVLTSKVGKPVVAEPEPTPVHLTWKKYPKEISINKWETLVDNPFEYDYDEWDRDKMKQVHFFDEEKIGIYKDEKTGNYIWSHKNIQSNVMLIDKRLNLYIVTTYHMDGTGLFVEPHASPVQLKTNQQVGQAAYDMMWTDKWLTHHCLKTAFYRMLELEEEEPD